MSRDALTVQEITIHGGSIDEITWTAGVAADDIEFVNDGKTLLLVKDAGGAGGKTITVVATSDPYGRTVDDSITTAAGGISIGGPYSKTLWNQSDGTVHVDFAVDTDLTLAAVKFHPAAS